jgi:hypothetical protein
MFQDSSIEIVLDKVPLIMLVHVVNNILHVKRRTHQTQGTDV